MVNRHDAWAVPRYLAVNAVLGGCVGAVSGGIVVGTDVVGLAELARGDVRALAVLPSFAGLFAVCAAASALGWRTPLDAGTHVPRDARPCPVDPRIATGR